MIGYITLGTNDLDRACAFYDAILGKMGATRVFENNRLYAWSFGEGKPLIVLNTPYDGQDASIGNGTMVALRVEDRETVETLHTLALQLGGKDEGPPGPRGEAFYGAYCRDLDGNKLNFHC
ncbi:VOC family protein [Pseudovibrio ascidiaceicola]|uniref:Predicted lactoylglutathione lyase n=1 Tax=Pseudovibrio ascidiaceicola TaxID=285279 RepID=A0A1I4EJX5_9HYPH|nr:MULTISPECIES: VOC family protein [Pseudovibrio]KZL13342.1 Glyoxalase-like domain protein [Pseudovibrio sp. Ad26]KZL17380.1 Glyoxalase-like domain protein [Pseudovibrio sp. WM33]SFL06042.1 Predicted lactoylglutathione lyase [Pseudovibrio ascidiaceicola]